MKVVTESDVKSRNVPFVFGYGGGVNSVAGIVGCVKRKLKPDLITFADTAGEKPGTYAYLKIISDFLHGSGFPPLTIVKKESPRTGDDSLEEECLRRETMPSRAFGLSSCAHRWKIEPQEKFMNHWAPAAEAWAAGRKPIKALGFDGGEERRATVFEDKKLRYWYPLIEWGWDRDECVKVIQKAGLPIPPKSACFFCPSSTKTEIFQLRRDYPRLFKRAIHMEKIALNSERHDLRTIKGLGRHFAWGDLPRLTNDELAKLPEAPVESCTICADSSED